MTNIATRRPPRSWELGTSALLVAVAATTALGLLYLAGDLALRQVLDTGGPVSPALRWLVDNDPALSALNLVLILAYLGGFYLWRKRSRDMLSRFVDDTVTPTRHWSIPAWNATLGASLLLSLTNSGGPPSNQDEVVRALTVDALRLGIRTAGLAVLVIGIVGIRGQIRRAIAEPRIPAPRPAPAPVTTPAPALQAAAAATTTATLTKSAPRPVEPVPGSEGLPPADDAFWTKIQETAAGTDAALLETTGLQDHKWRLIPAGSDVATVRAALRPGAVVTLFPEPAGQSPEGYRPPHAEEYHGLLESRETGAVWYQPVTPRRLPAFLTRAASASRWALYPADDPTRPQAVMPNEDH